MSDSLIDQYTKRPGLTADTPEESADSADDRGCFGWLRGIRDRAVMLELRRKDGHTLALGYAWLECAEYEPDQGITLHFSGRTVKITGSGLNNESRPLFEGITRHRVPWIRESDRAEIMKAGDKGTMVEAIECHGDQHGE